MLISYEGILDKMIEASKRSQGVSYAIREVLVPAKELEKKEELLD